MWDSVSHMEQQPPVATRVAAATRAALHAAGYTSLRAISDASGIPLSTLHRRLTGRAPLDMGELEKLAALAHVDVVDLFEANVTPDATPSPHQVAAGNPLVTRGSDAA